MGVSGCSINRAGKRFSGPWSLEGDSLGNSRDTYSAPCLLISDLSELHREQTRTAGTAGPGTHEGASLGGGVLCESAEESSRCFWR